MLQVFGTYSSYAPVYPLPPPAMVEFNGPGNAPVAFQPTNYNSDSVASKAVDGQIMEGSMTAAWVESNCAMTSNMTNPWW